MNRSGLERPFRVATRGSRLALWQAQHVADLLRQAEPGRTVEVVIVSTVGDRDRSQPLSRIGGEGVFTREIQEAVLDGRADVAVHSLKDLPTQMTSGLLLAGVPERAPRFDVLVLPRGSAGADLDGLPPAARIGTGSLRRRAQLRHQRPDLRFEEIRGNVETRLAKLDHGQYDALVLAEAGLQRLALADRVSALLAPPVMYPAVGQAAIGVECRSDDTELQHALQSITHAATLREVTAERSCLATLRAGCHAPVGVLSQIDEEQLTLTGVVLSADGTLRLQATETGTVGDALAIGRQVAEQLLAAGAQPLMDASTASSAD